MDINLLRTLLKYDPETGWFTWLVRPSRSVKAGARAGTLVHGYRAIGINGKILLEHRLIWMYVHGVMPTKFIDHINGIKDDNRIENLRECTQSQNQANIGKRNDNTSGHKGVSWDKHGKKWKVQIRVNNKKRYLGLFTSIEDAIAARRAAEIKYQGAFAYAG
jgi:hypothetical protein